MHLLVIFLNFSDNKCKEVFYLCIFIYNTCMISVIALSPSFLFQSQDDRFAFTAEWYDPNASLFRRYELLYYPKDGSVEMVRIKEKSIVISVISN